MTANEFSPDEYANPWSNHPTNRRLRSGDGSLPTEGDADDQKLQGALAEFYR